jgi:hypothetical protein
VTHPTEAEVAAHVAAFPADSEAQRVDWAKTTPRFRERVMSLVEFGYERGRSASEKELTELRRSVAVLRALREPDGEELTELRSALQKAEAERDESAKAVLYELNELMASIWELDNANAPISPDDCREIAEVIGRHVKRARAAIKSLLDSVAWPCPDVPGRREAAEQQLRDDDIRLADYIKQNIALEKELEEARRVISKAHKLVARGDGHGSVGATGACLIDAILRLKEAVTDNEQENASVVAGLSAEMEKVTAQRDESRQRVGFTAAVGALAASLPTSAEDERVVDEMMAKRAQGLKVSGGGEKP